MKARHKLLGQQGIAMVMVLLILLILALLGSTLLSYWYVDAVHGLHDVRRMQAYYIARSGADAMATYIESGNHAEDNGLQMHQYVESLNGQTSSEEDFGQGTFQVTVTKDAEDVIKISSVGRVGNISEKVSLTLQEMAIPGEEESTIYQWERMTWSHE